MKRHVKAVACILAFSVLVGVIAGNIYSSSLKKNEPMITPIPTVRSTEAPTEEPKKESYDDILQKFYRRVLETVDYKTINTFTYGTLPNNISEEQINKNSSEEVIAEFVIDASGSMRTVNEDRISKVKQTIFDFLPYIGQNTYIGVVTYSSDVVVNVPIAKFSVEQAKIMLGEIGKIDAVGSTAMYEGIAVGLKEIIDMEYSHPNARKVMFVISDGAPSKGFETIDFIEDFVKVSGIPIHTIGLGNSIDRVELKKIAQINEATFTYIDKNDSIDVLERVFYSTYK